MAGDPLQPQEPSGDRQTTRTGHHPQELRRKAAAGLSRRLSPGYRDLPARCACPNSRLAGTRAWSYALPTVTPPGRGMRQFSIVAFVLFSAVSSAHAQSIESLRGMSIDQLQNLDVSSVTKTREPLSGAPAAIYVITR